MRRGSTSSQDGASIIIPPNLKGETPTNTSKAVGLELVANPNLLLANNNNHNEEEDQGSSSSMNDIEQAISISHAIVVKRLNHLMMH